MAVGPSGVVAAVLNRPGSLGPAAGLRSRGELPLLAANAADAGAGAAVIAALPAAGWRPFNMVIADRTAAFFLRGTGAERADLVRLDTGVTMVTAHDPNDLASPRTVRHLPRFQATAAPEADDWAAWAALLADDSMAVSVADTLRVPPTDGFGTVSSSLLSLDATGRWRWRFAAVQPGSPAVYADVT